MSLDDETYVSSAEMVRRGHEADAALRQAEYEEQRLVESVEAEEQKWVGIMSAMPQHVRDIRYGSDVTS